MSNPTLKEALADADYRLEQASSISPPYHDTTLYTLAAAARRLLAIEESPDGNTSRNREHHSDSEVSHKLYWCITHNSPTGDLIIDTGSICFLRLDQDLWTHDCEFEQQRRMRGVNGE